MLGLQKNCLNLLRQSLLHKEYSYQRYLINVIESTDFLQVGNSRWSAPLNYLTAGSQISILSKEKENLLLALIKWIHPVDR